MTATLQQVSVSTPSIGHQGVCYTVRVDGDGCCIFSTACEAEALEFIKRINDYPEKVKICKDAQEAMFAAQKRLAALRRKMKGGAK